MTQFTFSELKPRIEAAITERSGAHRHSDLMPPHKEGLTTVKCPRCVSGLFWNNEPIEISDGFIPHHFFRIYQDSAIGRHEPHVEAIGKYTGQVYTWSLKALLPELWEEK